MASLIWFSFIGLILAMILLDLGIFHRKVHVISIREALSWTGVCVTLALLFNVLVYFLYRDNWLGWLDGQAAPLSGHDAALQFFTGYLVEQSLSMDNLFVIAMIFSYFHIPLARQHRVLFWGILGAIVMRFVMIAAGAALIERFSWMVYVFGGILLLSAAKMLATRSETLDPDASFVVRLVRRFYPIAPHADGGFFVRGEDGRWMATRLFLALVMVETTDVVFALDSIPAIFAITRDPFIVFTSNMFAILGLRSLFFALAGMMNKFRYLKISLVFILAYVGVKMILANHFHIDNVFSLVMIAAMLAVGILSSLVASAAETALAEPEAAEGGFGENPRGKGRLWVTFVSVVRYWKRSE